MKSVEAKNVAEEFSPIERELVVLKALTESLDSMLNHAVLTLRGTDPNTEIVFETSIHQRLFNILLVDFLAKPNKAVVGFDGSYLEVLSGICRAPSIGDRDTISDLAGAAEFLISWLNTEIVVAVWLPAVEQETNLAIRRHDFIWITGNISKHNFARLTQVSNKLVKIFQRNNVEISFHQALTILDEFYERFHGDILNYHASALAEMLNRVRWCIHLYLDPLFLASYVPDPADPPRYEYRYPEEVRHDFARSCFWNLMNEVRRHPYIRPFKAPWYLKERY
jgi:hypothetical protein